MTVAELIKALEAMPQDAEVWGGPNDIGRVLRVHAQPHIDGVEIVVLTEEG